MELCACSSTDLGACRCARDGRLGTVSDLTVTWGKESRSNVSESRRRRRRVAGWGVLLAVS